MKNKKLILLIIGLAVALIIVFASAHKGDKSAKVKIGLLTPLSGNLASVGEIQKAAVEMALNHLKSTGVDTSKYEIIYEDSKFDPKASLTGYEALKLRGARIIMADGSPVVAAIRPKAVEDKNLLFIQGATTPLFTDNSPYTCRLGLTADTFGPLIADRATNLGYSKAAIITPNNEYGKGMSDAISSSFKGKIVTKEIYDQATGDLRSNITKLLAAQKNIDVLFVINNTTPEPMFKQLHELGWNKPIVSDVWSITSPNMKDRSVANGTTFIDYNYSLQPELNTNDEAAAFARQYAEKYKLPPILLAALTYDSFNMIANAIEKTGSSNPGELTSELTKTVGYAGIAGDVTLDSSCNNTNTKFVWRKVTQQGKFESAPTK